MEITEVRIKLMEDSQERLLAFCSITLDGCFVIRDLKIIQGGRGIFVAMPSRKLTDHCPRCHSKNHLRAAHCNQCGAKLSDERADKDDEGRAKLYADIAHPINAECREMIQNEVVAAYEQELVAAEQPGYICAYDDYGEDRYAGLDEETYVETSPPAAFEAYGKKHRIDPPNGKEAAEHSGASSPNKKKRKQVAERASDEFGDGLF
ncbi:SpoVG family protein [Calycomorphotria hydatis]|uniref:Septation protein SpoVG n=1 Tax=Calycomorphotria hydatis TaxID=2528027 RepID=A0A517T9I1_9PLAN|nr:SpoVG family protein [Calycomorphotria hydatis]QDT65033.1 Putative septation protein SpoVG [Calycomorphotria hydatis]